MEIPLFEAGTPMRFERIVLYPYPDLKRIWTRIWLPAVEDQAPNVEITVMNPDGMLVFFAGVPNGTLAPLNLSAVYLDNAQYTGTSGLTIHDQQKVVDLATSGELSPGSIVGAVGGMSAAKDGLQALVEARYSGKVLIFPQIHDLPLTGVDELRDSFPDVAAQLGPGDTWTDEAERAFFEVNLGR